MQDDAKAAALFQQAVDQRGACAPSMLGTQDDVRTTSLFQQAANPDDAAAQRELGYA